MWLGKFFCKQRFCWSQSHLFQVTSTSYVFWFPHYTFLTAPWKIHFPHALSEWLPPRGLQGKGQCMWRVRQEWHLIIHPEQKLERPSVFTVVVFSNFPWISEPVCIENRNSNDWVYLYLKYLSLFTAEAFLKGQKMPEIMLVNIKTYFHYSLCGILLTSRLCCVSSCLVLSWELS